MDIVRINDKHNVSDKKSIIIDDLNKVILKYFPDLSIDTLDQETFGLLVDNIVSNEVINIDKNTIVNEDKLKNHEDNDDDLELDTVPNILREISEIVGNDPMIKESYYKAIELIPEMLVSNSLIYLTGRLYGKKINILFDSGAADCTIFKSVTDELNLDNIIDKNHKHNMIGIEGTTVSYGTLWYLDLELEVEDESIDDNTINTHYVSLPIMCTVADDTHYTSTKKKTKPDNKNKEKILTAKNLKFGLLLGINFMKLYKTQIDFSKRKIVINDNFAIKYN